MVTMAQRIEELRTKKAMSRPALAAALGLPRLSIEKFETGRQTPTQEQQQKLASAFGVSIDYLVGHDPAAGELIPTNLTDAELRLILNFRQLDDDQQRSMNLLVMQMTKDNKRNAKPQE